MKKSISKRVLALFLSALMVVTAIPFMAFAAQNDVNVAELGKAISDYENKMSTNNKNGKILTNLSAAYAEYLNAKKLYDSVYYGGVETTPAAIDNAKTKLEKATNSMTPYAPQVTANAKAQWKGAGHDDDKEDIDLAAAYSNKLLYADKFKAIKKEGGNDDVSGYDGALKIYKDVDNGHVVTFFQSGDVVMLYDGTNDYPRFPIFATVAAWGTNSQNPEIWSIWPGTTNSNDNRFLVDKPYNGKAPESLRRQMRGWVGGEPSKHWYQDNIEDPNAAKNFISGDYEHSLTSGNQGKVIMSNYRSSGSWKQNFRYLASTLQYTGTPTAYAENIHITWSICGISSSSQYSASETDTIHNTGVLNWKKIQELATKASGYPQLTSPQNYMGSSADLKALYNTIDGVTSFNPNTPNYSNVATAMTTINDTMTAANDAINSNAKADSYQSLREAMTDERRAKYEELAEVGFEESNLTKTSYNDYINTYKKAQELFKNNSYNDNKGATETAKALNALSLVDRANFKDYDEAKAKLVNGKYSEEALETLKLNGFVYSLDDEAKLDISATAVQSILPADIASINNLTEYTASDEYKAVVKEAEDGINNTDKYDRTGLENALKEAGSDKYCTDVVIATNDKTEYTLKGVNSDILLEGLLTAIHDTQFDYSVKVDGNEPFATGKHYGDKVHLPKGDYMMTVKPRTTDIVLDARYIKGDQDIIVRGDTVLTPCASSADSNCVTFKSSSGIVFNTVAASSDDTIDLSKVDIPVSSGFIVAGFKVNGVTYRAEEAGVVELNGAREVIVFLKPNTAKGTVYTIKLPGEEKAQEYVFNTEIRLTNDDTENKVFAKKIGEGKYYPLSTEKEYVFYAAENIEIELVDKSQVDMDKQAYASSEPIILGKSLMFVGSQLNRNVVSRGFVLDTTGQHNEKLTLANVDGSKGIYNLSVGHTCDQSKNQYTFTVGFSSPAQLNYVAYVILEDGTIKYSDVITAFEGK